VLIPLNGWNDKYIFFKNKKENNNTMVKEFQLKEIQSSTIWISYFAVAVRFNIGRRAPTYFPQRLSSIHD